MTRIVGVQPQETHAPLAEHPDVLLAELAACQHGVVSRHQLYSIGLSEGGIRHRIQVKRLHRVYHGVYSVALPLPRFGRYMGAVLACGEGAALSHRSAAALLGLGPVASGAVDVTRACAGSRRRRGIALHVTRCLPDEDLIQAKCILCTAPMRTVVDSATVVRHKGELKRMLERSVELNVFDRTSLEAVLDRSNGRRGVALLRELLADLPDELPPLASELERCMLELIVAAHVDDPVINGHIGTLQVDFHWPAHGLVLEVDGLATHGHVIAFHRDRERDLYLQSGGWRVIRLTWRQVVHEPERVVALLRRWLPHRR